MKAILEFDLSDIDEKLEHIRAIKGTDAYIALHHITNLLRTYRKYERYIQEDDSWTLSDGTEHHLTERESELLNLFASKIEEQIYGILEEHSIDLNDLR